MCRFFTQKINRATYQIAQTNEIKQFEYFVNFAYTFKTVWANIYVIVLINLYFQGKYL